MSDVAYVVIHWEGGEFVEGAEIRSVHLDRADAEGAVCTDRITNIRFRGDHDWGCCEVVEAPLFVKEAVPA